MVSGSIPINIIGHYEGSRSVILQDNRLLTSWRCLFSSPFLSEQGPTGSTGPRGQAVSKL